MVAFKMLKEPISLGFLLVSRVLAPERQFPSRLHIHFLSRKEMAKEPIEFRGGELSLKEQTNPPSHTEER
jgi:hypothetical protein